ncbi:MAG: flagellar hook-length control protein FliK [Betaproteobacteria bacterium]|nr:flagellar hook-length control protein FliK [Betaproteobacteria bacterium]
MNTLMIANPARTASPTHSAGGPAATADPGDADAGDLDFAGLLGAGIGRTTSPEQACEPVEITKNASGDTPACDPTALLDAIAAGKADLHPQQLTAAQIALQPMPASLAPVDSTAPAKATDSTTLPVIARDSAISARVRSDGGKSMPQADMQNTANSLRATDARHDADAGSAVTVAKTAAHEPVAVPVLKAELSERRQEPAFQLPTVGSTPGHAVAPSQSANTASVVAHVEQLAQPFGSPTWDDGFSSRVVWMAKNNVQSAEIRLNPPDLGPIEVTLVLTGDQGAQASASVQFSAAHAATREAIESALPRLREMLLENGIALGNTTVDARTAGNTDGSGDSGRPSHGSTRSDARAGQTPEPPIQPRLGSPLRRGSGLVDTFA